MKSAGTYLAIFSVLTRPVTEPVSTVTFATPRLFRCCKVRYRPTLSHPRGRAVKNVMDGRMGSPFESSLNPLETRAYKSETPGYGM